MIISCLAIAWVVFLLAGNILDKVWQSLVAGAVAFVVSLLLLKLELYIPLLIFMCAILIIGNIIARKRK